MNTATLNNAANPPLVGDSGEESVNIFNARPAIISLRRIKDGLTYLAKHTIFDSVQDSALEGASFQPVVQNAALKIAVAATDQPQPRQHNIEALKALWHLEPWRKPFHVYKNHLKAIRGAYDRNSCWRPVGRSRYGHRVRRLTLAGRALKMVTGSSPLSPTRGRLAALLRVAVFIAMNSGKSAQKRSIRPSCRLHPRCGGGCSRGGAC